MAMEMCLFVVDKLIKVFQKTENKKSNFFPSDFETIIAKILTLLFVN